MSRKNEQPWFKPVADRMVREDTTFRQAATEEGISLDVPSASQFFKSKAFQQVLWQARFEYYTEVSSNPARTKQAALGLMTIALQGLSDKGEWKEVLEGVLKLAKVEGWINGENNLNVFANLTAADIERERQKLLEAIGKPPTTETLESLPN